MFAFMNAESLALTLTTGKASYWSRSRNKLWVKGEESGNAQLVKELRVDCDQDVILLKVENVGGASCHNGYKSCFYRTLAVGAQAGEPDSLKLELVGRPLFDPATVYKKKEPGRGNAVAVCAEGRLVHVRGLRQTTPLPIAQAGNPRETRPRLIRRREPSRARFWPRT